MSPICNIKERLVRIFFLDIATQADQSSGKPQSVLFGSFYQTKVTLWNCIVQSNTRNVTAQCIAATSPSSNSPVVCGTQNIGPSIVSSRTPLNNLKPASILFDLWPKTDKASSNISSYTEQSIALGIGSFLADELVDLSTADNVIFSTRLTTLFNKWYITAVSSDLN
jgi:hypothetical protein